MKIVKIATVVVIVLVAALVISYQVFFRLPLPEYSVTIEIEGLNAPVEVRFDEYGIPHIFAENEHDLFFAQGYITARDRMFGMEINRLAGRGELSTIFGEATKEDDRYLKTVGLYRAATKEYENMSKEVKDVVNAYTEGVNAFIKNVKHLPREYTILGVEPSPWLPEDTVVAPIFMGLYLEDSLDLELPMNRIREIVGEEKFSYFHPSYPDFAPTISHDKIGKIGYKSPIEERNRIALKNSHRSTTSKSFKSRLPGFVCSNWMIFGPESTTTNNTVFTGSPDLTPSIPAIFYLVHLKGAGYDIIGGSYPGMPGVSGLGFNGYMAFSSTDGMLDGCDFFVEKVNPDNPNQYMTENGWVDFEIVEETLKIKTKKGIVEEKFDVKISRHGPIISDVDSLAPENTAVMWVGSEGSGGIDGIIKLNKAKNFEEFRRGAHHIILPPLNLGYADKYGNIGYQYLGKLPIRKKGDGVLPVPGWDGKHDWIGYVPQEELPHDLNPGVGYIGGFNNEPKKGKHHVSGHYYFERAMGFDKVMEKKGGSLSPEEIRMIQLDSFSVVAERWVPEVIRVSGDDDELSKYIVLFEGWDYHLDTESPAAALYSAFYFHLLENSFRDEFGEDYWLKFGFTSQMINYLDMTLTKHIDDEKNPWFDDVTTEDVVETKDDIIIKSIREAADEMTELLGKNPTKWRWGDIHQFKISHLMGEELPFLNLKQIPVSGDFFTLGASGWEGDNPFDVSYGGCIRMIIDFSDIEGSTFISPPGQSGQYMSPHYDDMVKNWLTNDQVPLRYLDAEELPNVLILESK